MGSFTVATATLFSCQILAEQNFLSQPARPVSDISRLNTEEHSAKKYEIYVH
jgi:hypothetical protein